MKEAQLASRRYLRRKSRRKLSLKLFGTLTVLQAVYSFTAFLASDQNSQIPRQRVTNMASWQSSNAEKTNPHRLRFDWTNLENLSALAKLIEQSQNNCERPMGHFWFRNRFGLGSDLHVWSQAVCNAMHFNKRVFTVQPWIWLDQESCDTSATSSSVTCYFPRSEILCQGEQEYHDWHFNLSRGRGRIRNDCEDFLIQQNATLSDLRAAAMEFLFSGVSETVQTEAERQLEVVFRSKPVPDDLITVHIRWGDKIDEMDLVPAAEYIQAVRRIQKDRGRSIDNANVFLATEDPRAVYEFVNAAPDTWNIFVDAYFQELYRNRAADKYNNSPLLARDLNGRPGVVALGSLLVAMEANDFILTTKSNWSRLINELRKNVVSPRCNNCTRVVDLNFGEW